MRERARAREREREREIEIEDHGKQNCGVLGLEKFEDRGEGTGGSSRGLIAGRP